MTVQIVEIGGQKIAMLPVEEYRQLVDLAEDKADALAAQAAEARRLSGEEYVPAELVEKIIAGERPLRVWRSYRGLTLEQLALQASIGQSYLSMIEAGRRQGKPALWRALAEALDVSVDDILPLE